MNVLLAYGHDQFTTAIYLERSLRKHHNVLFCGTPSVARPEGYPLFLDLGEVLRQTGFKPDLYFYVEAGYPCFPLGVEKLDCPTAALMIDMFPISDAEAKSRALTLFDYPFVIQKDDAQKVRAWDGITPGWLAPACDPEVHRDRKLSRTLDIGFVGSLGKIHRRREALLAHLAGKYKMNDFRQRAVPAEMSRIYSQSKIVVNFCTPWDDINMRVFEAMACGALLITPRIGNGMDDLFREGEHLVSYDTDEGLLAKVDYYLKHEDERARIAAAGQAHVLVNQTYDRRIEQLLREVFEINKGAKRCPLRNAPPEAARAAARPYLALLLGRNMLHNFYAMRATVGFDATLPFRFARSVYRSIVMPRKKSRSGRS